MEHGYRRKRRREYSESESTGSSRDASPRHSRTASRERIATERKHLDGSKELGEGDVQDMWRRIWTKGERDCFDKWIKLFTAMEEDSNVVSLDDWRRSLRAFLVRWPYCFGFWCKWAKLEQKEAHADKVVQVYELAVSNFPSSIDIWLSYLRFCAKTWPEDDDKYEDLIERAFRSVRLHWTSDLLWHEAIEFYKRREDSRKVTELLEELLGSATNRLADNWQKMESHLKENCVTKTLSVTEVREHSQKLSKSEAIENRSETVEDDNEMEEELKLSEEVLEKVREAALMRRMRIYKKTVEDAQERIMFESQLRRPYFHAKPLDRAQLEAWDAYLDWEMKCSSEEKTQALFERCLVACCLYDEFWIKYANWAEEGGRIKLARGIFGRARKIHCRKSVMIALAASAFEESLRNHGKAREILERFSEHSPHNMFIASRKISLNRREKRVKHKKMDMSQWYREMRSFEQFPEEFSCFAVKQARFLLRVNGDYTSARHTILGALARDQSNEYLYLQLVEIELSRIPFHEKNVCEALDYCIASPHLGLPQRIRFSQRKLDLLEDLSLNIKSIQAHHLFHSRLLALDNINPHHPPSTTNLTSSDDVYLNE